jgi:hypothetical protein
MADKTEELDDIISKVEEMLSRRVTYFANTERKLLDGDDEIVITKLLDKTYSLIQENIKLSNANTVYIKSIQNIAPVLTNEYIEKSVIKEKIEEYKNLIKKVLEDEEYCGEIPLYEHDIQILEELLESE